MSTARDQLLHAIFTTALEGGINYWSTCSEYYIRLAEPKDDLGYGPDDLLGFRAEIFDTEDDLPYVIDRKVIVSGWAMATGDHRDKINWSTEKPPIVVTEDTDWDFDAGDADCIVQLGLFGEVRYG